MRFTSVAPANRKLPPAASVGPPPRSTRARQSTVVSNPVPTGAQLVPSHRATFSAAVPHALENTPPTKSAGPLPSSWTSSAPTAPFTPGSPANVGTQAEVQLVPRASWSGSTRWRPPVPGGTTARALPFVPGVPVATTSRLAPSGSGPVAST
jgi:hypothetical protein